MNILNGIKSRYADYRLNKINKMETSIQAEKFGVKSSLSSPPKLMPDKLKITVKTLPRQLSIAKNMEYAVKSIKDNPKNPETSINPDFMEDIVNYALSLGIDKVGFTEVPPEFIFQDRCIIYSNAIVFLMEMDKKSVDQAPSDITQEMSTLTYDEMGKATNQITQYLRENGFAAQASHPAGGFVVYPALAQRAGLGWKGRHGMLITPEFGPRQRISAIFTSIKNLPHNGRNDHFWVSEFCEKCGKCIRTCPANAITEDGNGDKRTVILKEFCHGCTICMRECSFNKRDYNRIKSSLGM